MEFLNYVRPKDRLLVLQNAYERLKPLIQKGNAQVEIEEDLRGLARIPVTLVGTSSRFNKIYNKLKFKFIRYDDPESD